MARIETAAYLSRGMVLDSFHTSYNPAQHLSHEFNIMSHGFLIKQKWPRYFIDAPGSAFPEVSKQTGQPREVNPNFRKFLPGSFLSIQPCSQNLLTYRQLGRVYPKREVDGWHRGGDQCTLGYRGQRRCAFRYNIKTRRKPLKNGLF